MNRLKFLALAAMALALFTTTQAAANLLLNPGFETDAVLDAEPSPFVTDWSAFNGASTASKNLAPARSGIGSLWGPGFGIFRSRSVPNFSGEPGGNLGPTRVLPDARDIARGRHQCGC